MASDVKSFSLKTVYCVTEKIDKQVSSLNAADVVFFNKPTVRWVIFQNEIL